MLKCAHTDLQVVFPTPPFPPTNIHLSEDCSSTLESVGSSSSSGTDSEEVAILENGWGGPMPITHVSSRGFERPRDRKVERFLTILLQQIKPFWSMVSLNLSLKKKTFLLLIDRQYKWVVNHALLRL